MSDREMLAAVTEGFVVLTEAVARTGITDEFAQHLDAICGTIQRLAQKAGDSTIAVRCTAARSTLKHVPEFPQSRLLPKKP